MPRIRCGYGGHFRRLPARRGLGRDVRRPRQAPRALRRAGHRCCSRWIPAELRYRADQLARVFTDRGVTYDFAGEERPFPLDLIPRVIDAVEWDLVSPRRPAAGQGPRGVPGRRLRAGPGVRRRRGPVAAGLHQREVPPRGRRHHPAERRPGARGRHRPDPRRERQVPGARGQRAGAVRRELRDREPAGHDQDVPRPVRRAAHPPGRRVPVAAARRAAGRRPARRRPTRSSSCSPPACTTPRTSSTPCWPG